MILMERPSSLHSRTRIEFPSQPPSLNIAEQISGPLILSCSFCEQWTWPSLPNQIALSQEFLCLRSLGCLNRAE